MIARIVYSRTGERSYFLDGKPVTKEEYDAAIPSKPIGVPMTAAPSAWPLLSDAAGVIPEQIPEAMEVARKHGVPTEFDPQTGQAIFTSREHRKRYCQLYRMHDKNGGYGDA